MIAAVCRICPDAWKRPCRADVKALLAIRRPSHKLLADRAYDAASLRDWLIEREPESAIPPSPTRKHPHAYDRDAYRGFRGMIQ